MAFTKEEVIIDLFEKNGLDPEVNRKILEIGSSPEESLSKYLEDCYPETFLLYKYIPEKDLFIYVLDCGSGKIENGKIVFNQTSENAHLMKLNGEFDAPTMEEIDTIVCRGFFEGLKEIVNLKDKYIFIGSTEKKDLKKYRDLRDALNNLKLNEREGEFILTPEKPGKKEAFAIVRRRK